MRPSIKDHVNHQIIFYSASMTSYSDALANHEPDDNDVDIRNVVVQYDQKQEEILRRRLG